MRVPWLAAISAFKAVTRIEILDAGCRFACSLRAMKAFR
jgi:hypothetical protein